MDHLAGSCQTRAFARLTADASFFRFPLSCSLQNPAIAFGLGLVGIISKTRALIAAIASLLGGIAAAALISVLLPGPLRVSTRLGQGTSISQGLFLEVGSRDLFLLACSLIAIVDELARACTGLLPILPKAFLTFTLMMTVFMCAAEKVSFHSLLPWSCSRLRASLLASRHLPRPSQHRTRALHCRTCQSHSTPRSPPLNFFSNAFHSGRRPIHRRLPQPCESCDVVTRVLSTPLISLRCRRAPLDLTSSTAASPAITG